MRVVEGNVSAEHREEYNFPCEGCQLWEMPLPSIALLTDFGLHDPYVGVMKGIIAGISPHTPIIDITHMIEPQNVVQGATVLAESYHYFPPRTIFVCVVDPGVGSQRNALAVRVDDYVFLAPDNGLLSLVIADAANFDVVTLSNGAYFRSQVSRTFHGRDIFAPVAAHIANGVLLSELGSIPPRGLVTLPPLLTVTPGVASGQITRADRFGNLITSIGNLRWLDNERLELSPKWRETYTLQRRSATMQIGDKRITRFVQTYYDAPNDELVALVSSGGFLEIAIKQGNAAQRLDVSSGKPVTLLWKTDES